MGCLICKYCVKRDEGAIDGINAYCMAPAPPWALSTMDRLRGNGMLLKADLSDMCSLYEILVDDKNNARY